MDQHLETAEDILGFVIAERSAGRRCCLGVVTDVIGGSARSTGTLIAVSEAGILAGYVSNGCIDADLKTQALMALDEGKPRGLIYGAGSPFMDLRLPCGGSVRILLDPNPNPALCFAARETISARRVLGLVFSREDGLVGVSHDQQSMAAGRDRFVASYAPRMRLILAGRGAPLIAVSRVASALAVPITALSPDADDGARLGEEAGMRFHALTSTAQAPELGIDDWTAVLTLFHAHEWEAAILRQALDADPFYIGAMGSQRTHQDRLMRLREVGFPEHALRRINGPVGLIRSVRDAPTLAISVLAEISGSYRQAVARATEGPQEADAKVA